MVYSRVVTDRPADIPKRAAYKAAEVCAIAQIQPYVLRSWESEFPKLGVARGAGVARIYRQADLEQVLRIKQLVFEEGLTLAGARRRLETETEAQRDLPLEEFLSPDAKQRIASVRQGLRDLLSLLGGEAHGDERLAVPATDAPGQAEPTANEPPEAQSNVRDESAAAVAQETAPNAEAPTARRTPRRPRTERRTAQRA